MEISRTKIYEVGNYKFYNFTILGNNTIEEIRLWRNHPVIRKEMYKTDEITIDQHQKFIKSLSDSDDKYYWLAYRNNIPIGVANIVDVNYSLECGESGSYLLPEYIGSGLGLEFNSILLSLLFKKIGLKKIFARTQIDNRNALAINYHLGFQFHSQIVEINDTKFIEMNLDAPRYIERTTKINESKELLKTIKEFNKIYKSYK